MKCCTIFYSLPISWLCAATRFAQNHSSGIYSESGYLNYYVENTIYKNEK